MATHYKGKPIEAILDELRTAKDIFDQVDPDSLDHNMFAKVCKGYAYIAIAKAKLTALQREDTKS